MAERLYSPAEIFEAQALACQPEQLLPQGKSCKDCADYALCQFMRDEPIGENRSCAYMPGRFRDVWQQRPQKSSDEEEASDHV